MSGFVVASAYERRLAGDRGLGAFVGIRLRRLAPLWIAGVVVGAGLAPVVPADQHHLALLAALCVLLIPQGLTFLTAFPLNGSLWSLHVELVVNTLYGRLVRALTTPVLLAVAGVSLLALIAIACAQGALSDGSSRLDLVTGFLRALFAFPVGDRPIDAPVQAWLKRRAPAAHPTTEPAPLVPSGFPGAL